MRSEQGTKVEDPKDTMGSSENVRSQGRKHSDLASGLFELLARELHRAQAYCGSQNSCKYKQKECQ